MVKSHGGLEDVRESGAAAQSFPPLGEGIRAASPRGDPTSWMKLSRAAGGEDLAQGGVRQCWPAGGAGDTAEDDYYWDLLVCSDVLREQDNALWQHQLHPTWSPVWPETDQVKLTRQPEQPRAAGGLETAPHPGGQPHPDTGGRTCPTGDFSATPSGPALGMGSPLAEGDEGICPISPQGLSPPTTRAKVTSCSSPPSEETTESVSDSGIDLDIEGVRVTQVGREGVLKKEEFYRESPGQEGSRAGSPQGELERMGSEENIDTWPTGAERQPLLLKDGETSFIKKTVSSTKHRNDRSACHVKKADLLSLNTYVKLSAQPADHDHEAECDKLNADCKILNNALTVESVAAQTSDFKDKYHIQDKGLLNEKSITKDGKISCINKEYQGSNSDCKAKIEHTRHVTEPLIRDCCLESKNSDLCEDSSIHNKELGTLEHSSELHIHNAYLVHPPSIVCKGSESDVFKKEGTCRNIDPYLDNQSCLTIPVQIQDISGSLDISSNIFQIGGKCFTKESKYTSNVHPNDNPGFPPDEDTFQISECYRNKSSLVDACGNELIHSDSMEVVSPIAMLEDYNRYKELINTFEQPVLQNRTSQKGAAKSHYIPLNRGEKHDWIQCHSDASENKVHNENRSTSQSMWYSETAENETHNNKLISSFPETGGPATCQLEEQLPVELPVLLECNLEIQSNILVPFNGKTDGSDWLSQEMEYKTNSTAAKPLVVTHQDANAFTLVDHEKMENDEPSLCWNSSSNNNENISHEDTSNVTYIENETSCEAKNCQNNDHLQDVIGDRNNEQRCNQLYSATEIVMSPVSCPPIDNEHLNFQLRIGQMSNSETVPNLNDQFMALQYNDEPKVVKSDALQSSMLCLTEQNISPLTGRDQLRMINNEANSNLNSMECGEYPDPKEQKSSTVCPPALGQSISHQEIPRPIQNSMGHVIDVDMKDECGRVQEMEDVQAIVIDRLESSLIDGSNLNIAQIFQPTLQQESHFGYLSMPVAEETKTGTKSCDIDINAVINCDERMAFQGEFSHGEKNLENHNVTSAECDSEIVQGYNNKKMRSAENLESTTFSIGSMMKAPPEIEQMKDLNVKSTTIGLNKHSKKVKYLGDCKANLSEGSKCFVRNMGQNEGIQIKEWQIKNNKETAVVTEECDKTVQCNDFFQSTVADSIGSSIITQPMEGQIMNVDSNALADCRDCSKRPRGCNQHKVNNKAIVADHPLKCIKMDTDAECKGKFCQMFTLPSKSNQKYSTDDKVENLPLTYKNDKNRTEPPSTHILLRVSLYESLKKTIDPEPAISLQTKSSIRKSIPSTSSLNKQQATAVRMKQPLSVAWSKELMSGAQENARFQKPSSEAAKATTETLAPSLTDQQKEEPVKRMRLSADNVGKSTLAKSKPTYSPAGKENLNKDFAAIKRMSEKTKEELTHKKEQKDLKKAKHPQQDDQKAPKLIQKIHTEVFPETSGNVKLWCRFCDIHADSTIIWTKNGAVLSKVERSAGDDSPVYLAIVQTTKKDGGLYQCSLKNVYGSVSCEFDFTTEVLNELLNCQAFAGKGLIKSVNPDDHHASPRSAAGEEIELLQPIIEKELTNECNFHVKMCGSLATEELHFGEGLHRKAFRTKVICGFLPLFYPGHNCVLKIHNAISHGTKTNSELIKQNYMLAVQECHVQTAARQYGNMFSAEGTLLEGFGEAPEIIPINLIHRPANSIPYATVEEELIGEFVKYSVKDGRELNVGRKESEVGLKCCTFQHWVYQWTEGNLLVTDLQGVGMKLTDIGIATSRKGYKGFKGNCSISFIDQFKALHQCNMYCKMMGLKSLNDSQLKHKRSASMKTQASQPIPRSTKKTTLSPQSTRRTFLSQAKSIFGDKTLQKHL
ncbi:alpha-protein kinase 2 isoform X1 [Scyliorhinus canicula]|uniref:alpha-protein kinase 2 isoform X1 n=1 Tax=Scyliorhinus canicula TaxID=7830 RepID=UPI0018F38772|nr:alpha-protein kinase 2 isoform X1 [Scyliorhinus canicula]